MTSTTATELQIPPVLKTVGAPIERRMKVDGTDPKYGDWRDDLVRDGYAVIKGAVPSERAAIYADRMLALLESL
jgi:hypothetical protein